MGGMQLVLVRSMAFGGRSELLVTSCVVRYVRRNMGKEGQSKARPHTALQRQTRYFGRSGSIGKSPVSFPFAFLKIAQLIPLLHGSGSVPYFFARTAVTHDLCDFIIELRPSSTSAGLSENIKR